MIELNHISKHYGNIHALKDLSMNVTKGSIMGLLGKNGAGKTTLMNILVGCLRQDEGTVEIAGFDMQEDPLSAKRAFGYLPENVPIYPELTVEECLNFAAKLNLVPKAELKQTVDMALERMGLKDLRNRVTGAMSKGQRQRVGIAQAMFCTQAKILILDEPTSGLDPSQIAGFRSMIKEMRGEYTILLSSHILSDITAVCDEIAVIDGGKLITQGKIDELTERFASFTTLELTVESGAAALLERLREHPGVLQTQTVGTTIRQDVKLVVRTDGDMRADIFRMAVEVGATLLNMSAPESTLDNIFARVTGAGQEDA